MFKQSGMKITAACAAGVLGLGVATTAHAAYFADNFNSYTQGNFSTNTKIDPLSGNNGPFYTVSPDWTTENGSGNPKFTTGRYDYPEPWNGTDPLEYVGSDESPFSAVPDGYGINYNDAKTNDGNSRTLTTTWTIAPSGQPGDGTGSIGVSFDFVTHNVPTHTYSGTGTNNFSSTDNAAFYVRLFDSSNSDANNGFWLRFANLTETNFDMTYFQGTVQTGLATTANAGANSTYSQETWYHVEIALTVDGTNDGNLATITITPDGGSAMTLYKTGTEVDELQFRLSNNTTQAGLLDKIDSFRIGTISGTSAIGNFSFDNVLVIPEPASMGLMGLGTLLVLARRR